MLGSCVILAESLMFHLLLFQWLVLRYQEISTKIARHHPTLLQKQCFRSSHFFLFNTKKPIMDHSFHLLTSVQDNLLRHLHVMYSPVIAQNNVLSLGGNEIWIINVNSPPQKSVPVSLSPHQNFGISNNGSHCSANMRNLISDNF